MYRLLSYPISQNSAVWPGGKKVACQQIHHVEDGSEWNEWMYTLTNHLGTHYDAPNHHYNAGLKISDLPLERFVFEKPYILDIPKGPNEKITKDDLVPFAEKIQQCDALFLRTGFFKHHHEPELYCENGPGVGSDAAEYLVKHFLNLKVIVLDFLSLNAYSDIPDGMKAHKWLLGEWTDHFICIIEDAHFEDIENETLEKVIALPLLIEELDSAQVTVMAFEKNGE